MRKLQFFLKPLGILQLKYGIVIYLWKCCLIIIIVKHHARYTILFVINARGAWNFPQGGAFTRSEIVSTKITKKCEFWFKILNEVDINTGFDRSRRGLATKFTILYDCKSWLINLLVLMCCDFLSFYQQFGFQWWGCLLERGHLLQAIQYIMYTPIISYSFSSSVLQLQVWMKTWWEQWSLLSPE